MPVFSSAYLLETSTRILAAAGAPSPTAGLVASHLVEANLTGHDSHGLIRLVEYVAEIERGAILPQALPEVLGETPVSAVLDGNWGFGQLSAGRAVLLGRDKARKHGMAGITARRSNHIGRLGAYVEELAAQGLVGLLFANLLGGGPVVPWGGKSGRLGTNPLAVGIPASGDRPLVLDMATSVVAEGKVRVRRNRGEEAPAGWLIDAEGRPTRDPRVLYQEPRGSLLPFGGAAGHKGFGLAVIVELLAGALSGSGCAGGGSSHPGNGLFLLVVDVEHFVPLDVFRRQVEDLTAFLKSAPCLPGFAQVLVPGEPEEREKERRSREGIWVEADTWNQIVACARQWGVEPGSLP